MTLKKRLAVRVEPHTTSISYADLQSLLILDKEFPSLLDAMHQLPFVEFRLFGGTLDKFQEAYSKKMPIQRINDLDFIAVVDDMTDVKTFLPGAQRRKFGPNGRTGFTIPFQGLRHGVRIDVTFTFYFSTEFKPDKNAVFDTVGMSEYIVIPKKGQSTDIRSHYHDPSFVAFCRENRVLFLPQDLTVRFMSIRNYMREAKFWSPISRAYSRRVQDAHIALCSDITVNLAAMLNRTMLSHFDLSDTKGKEQFLKRCIQASRRENDSTVSVATQNVINAAESLGYVGLPHQGQLELSTLEDDLNRLSTAWVFAGNDHTKSELVSLFVELTSELDASCRFDTNTLDELCRMCLEVQPFLSDLETQLNILSRLSYHFQTSQWHVIEPYLVTLTHQEGFESKCEELAGRVSTDSPRLIQQLFKAGLSRKAVSEAFLNTLFDSIFKLPKRIGKELVLPYLDHVIHNHDDQDFFNRVMMLWDSFPRTVSPKLFAYISEDVFYEKHQAEMRFALNSLVSKSVVIPSSFKQRIIDDLTQKHISVWSVEDHHSWELCLDLKQSDVSQEFIADALIYFSSHLDKIDASFVGTLIQLVYSSDIIFRHKSHVKRLVLQLIDMDITVPEYMCSFLEIDLHHTKPLHETVAFYEERTVSEGLHHLKGISNQESRLTGFYALFQAYDDSKKGHYEDEYKALLEFVSQIPVEHRSGYIQSLFKWLSHPLRQAMLTQVSVVRTLFSDDIVFSLKPKDVVVILGVVYKHRPSIMQDLDSHTQCALLELCQQAPKRFQQFVEPVLDFLSSVVDTKAKTGATLLFRGLSTHNSEWFAYGQQVLNDYILGDAPIPDEIYPVLFYIVSQLPEKKVTANIELLKPLLDTCISEKRRDIRRLLSASRFDFDLMNYAYAKLNETGEDVLFSALDCKEIAFSKSYLTAMLKYKSFSSLVAYKEYYAHMPKSFIWDVLSKVEDANDQEALSYLEDSIRAESIRTPDVLVTQFLPLFKKGVSVEKYVKHLTDIYTKIESFLSSDTLDLEDKYLLIKLVSQSFNTRVFERSYSLFKRYNIDISACGVESTLVDGFESYLASEDAKTDVTNYSDKISKTVEVLSKTELERSKQWDLEVSEIRSIILFLASKMIVNNKSFRKTQDFPYEWKQFKRHFMSLPLELRHQLYNVEFKYKGRQLSLKNTIFWMRDTAMLTDAVGCGSLSLTLPKLIQDFPDYYTSLFFADDVSFLKAMIDLGLSLDFKALIQNSRGERVSLGLFVSAVGHDAPKCAEFLAQEPSQVLETLPIYGGMDSTQLYYMLTMGLDQGVALAHKYGKISKSADFVFTRTASVFSFIVNHNSKFKSLNPMMLAGILRGLKLLIKHGYIDINTRIPTRFGNYDSMSIAELVAYQACSDKKGTLLSILQGLDNCFFPLFGSPFYGRFAHVLLKLAGNPGNEASKIAENMLLKKLPHPPSRDAFASYFGIVEDPSALNILYRLVRQFSVFFKGGTLMILDALNRLNRDFHEEFINELMNSGYEPSFEDVKALMKHVRSSADVALLLNVMKKGGVFERCVREQNLMGIVIQYVPNGFKVEVCRAFLEHGVPFLDGSYIHEVNNPMLNFLRENTFFEQLLSMDASVYPTSIYALKYTTADDFAALMSLGMPVEDRFPDSFSSKKVPGLFSSLFDCAVYYYQHPEMCSALSISPEDQVTFKHDMSNKIRLLRPDVDLDSIPLIVPYDYDQIPAFTRI